MNQKFYPLFVVIVTSLLNSSLPLRARNPLEILSLNPTVTDSEIKDRCRALSKKYHGDKGGNDKILMQINAACDDLLKNGRNECKKKNIDASCKCPNGIERTCIKGFTNHNTLRCDCPLSNDSLQTDTKNKFYGLNIIDECYYRGQPCTDMLTQKKGACKNFNEGSEALFCNPYDSCKNNPTNKGKECLCAPTKNKGLCAFDNQDEIYNCQCSNDECENNPKNDNNICHCPDTHNLGTCHAAILDNKNPGHRCVCSNDVCENNPTFDGKTCTCESGNKGTCSADFASNVHGCHCSEDECENNKDNVGKSCQCPAGYEENGICQAGTLPDGNTGYQCACKPKQLKRSWNASDFDEQSYDPATGTYFTKHYDPAMLYSINITAPIYNLPLQRVLRPTSDCAHWWFSVAPFTQHNDLGEITTDKLGRFEIRNAESGLMFNLGYYDSWWYVHTLFSLAGSNTKVQSNFEDNLHPGHSRFGNLDTLIGAGLQTKHDSWKLDGEYFIGISDQRIQNGTVKHLTEPLSLGTGIQGNFDFTVYENGSSRYELSTLSRFTYFVPTPIEWQDAKDHHKLCTVRYSPGGFIDLFLGLKQYYDCGGQFIIDFGYNPTFHIIKQSTEMLKTDIHANLDIVTETIPSVRHTIYAIYGYNWDSGKMPMNISFGGSGTLAPHTNMYGTFFATYSLGF